MTCSIEVLCSWESTASLREDWDRLAEEKGIWFSFTNYHWFSCWYDAFCPQGAARISVIREQGKVVGILPGLHLRKSIGPFTLPCFAYAANGLTPNTVLMLGRNLMNEDMLFRQLADAMPERVDILDIPVVEVGGDDWHYLNRQKQWLALFEENREVSFNIDMPDGLQAYLDSRSSKFRKNARYRCSKISKDFGVKMEIVPLGVAGVLERLESLSAKTWQEVGGSGLFSEKYARFSNSFLREPCRHSFIAFLSLNGIDVAFNLFQTKGRDFISYKIGFDGSYGAWSPGEVLNHMMYEVLCNDGVQRFMLLGGVTGSKQLWATNTGEMVNYWFFSNSGLKTRFVYLALVARRKIKALYARS